MGQAIHALQRDGEGAVVVTGLNGREIERRGNAVLVGVCEFPAAATVARILALYLRYRSDVGEGIEGIKSGVPVGKYSMLAVRAGDVDGGILTMVVNGVI